MRTPAAGFILFVACLCAAMFLAEGAGACSCVDRSFDGDGERAALGGGRRAFIGTVVSKRRANPKAAFPRVYEYRIRVGRSFNVALGRTLRLTIDADGTSCGFEWRRGQRVAAYLFGRKGRWGTSFCNLASPRDLVRDSKPYPRPARRGRVAMLAYGGFSDASALALDRRGRILGYGFGGGSVASVCPGGSTTVEAGPDRRGRSRLYTRDLSTLRTEAGRRVEAFDLRCMDASGTDVVLAKGGLYERYTPATLTLLRQRDGRRQVLRRGRATALGFSARFAFTIEGRGERQIVATDLGNGRSRRIARLPYAAGQLAVSPNGTRLAVTMQGLPDPPRRDARLAVIDLNGSRPRVRLRRLQSPFAGGDLVWMGDRRLLRAPYDGQIRAYTARLRPLGRFGKRRGGAFTLVDDGLFEISYDALRFVSTARRAQERVRSLPTASTSNLLAVPGEPRVFYGKRRPVTKRPKVRLACRPRS